MTQLLALSGKNIILNILSCLKFLLILLYIIVFLLQIS